VCCWGKRLTFRLTLGWVPDSKGSVDHAALSQLSRDDLIALLLTQEARIAELERRLGLNSANGGRPPSSDGLKKLVRVGSLREASGRRPAASLVIPARRSAGRKRPTPGSTISRRSAPDAARP
jgi:hypothetical protein